jgi:hypothetical protein
MSKNGAIQTQSSGQQSWPNTSSLKKISTHSSKQLFKLTVETALNAEMQAL